MAFLRDHFSELLCAALVLVLVVLYICTHDGTRAEKIAGWAGEFVIAMIAWISPRGKRNGDSGEQK